MKRRQFLQHTALSAAASLPLFLNGSPVHWPKHSPLFNVLPPENDKILVLIHLGGGNDGLNTIIPLDQYDGLAQVRENIMIPEDFVQPLTDLTGVHPALSALRSYYEQGKAGVVQSVGYPNQNRSHFRSMDIWNTGSSAEETWSTGWLGRYLDTVLEGFPEGYPNDDHPHPPAITMGGNVVETCQGLAANYTQMVYDPFSLNPLLEGEGSNAPGTYYGDELAFLRHAIIQTNAYGEVIENAAEMGANTVNYPDNNLSRQLRNVALLASGGLRTKIYIVSLGGFDTHAQQVIDGSPLGGQHSRLLKMISEAVTAFQIDLENQGLDQRVLSMTFSEFGRRIHSNNGLGTDHGTAAPVMLFGSCVNAQVLGDNPEIDGQVHPGEGLPLQHDFRDLYGSILQDWFEVPEDQVRDLLYADYTHLPLLNNCEPPVTNTEHTNALKWEVSLYPNPCTGEFTFSFVCSRARVRMELYDSLGRRVRLLGDRQLPPGRHRVRVDASELVTGVYHLRLQVGAQVATKRVVKQ